jgi:flagellar biosynthesis regulator FlbT
LNSHERAYFAFEGDVPIIRGKDVLQPELARNSLEKLYCCIQKKIYLEQAFAQHQDALSALMARALSDEPSLLSDLKEVEALVLNRDNALAKSRVIAFLAATSDIRSLNSADQSFACAARLLAG